MITKEENGKTIMYPSEGYKFTSDGTDDIPYYCGTSPLSKFYIEVTIDYVWGTNMSEDPNEEGDDIG